MGTQPPPPKKGHRSIPTFQPMCRLWPNCYMDQDATWYGGRPRSRLHCVRRGSSSPSPKGGQSLLFGPCLLWSKFKRLESMDQDATWYGGMGLGTGYIALDGDPATAKRGTSPNFRPMSVVAKQLHGWVKMPLTKVGLGRGDIMVDGYWGPSSPSF